MTKEKSLEQEFKEWAEQFRKKVEAFNKEKTDDFSDENLCEKYGVPTSFTTEEVIVRKDYNEYIPKKFYEACRKFDCHFDRDGSFDIAKDFVQLMRELNVMTYYDSPGWHSSVEC